MLLFTSIYSQSVSYLQISCKPDSFLKIAFYEFCSPRKACFFFFSRCWFQSDCIIYCYYRNWNMYSFVFSYNKFFILTWWCWLWITKPLSSMINNNIKVHKILKEVSFFLPHFKLTDAIYEACLLQRRVKYTLIV